jgi:hypothetical protein
LDDHIAGGEMHRAFIKFEVEFAREHNAVVDRARRVHIGVLRVDGIARVIVREIFCDPGAGGQEREHTHDRPADGRRKANRGDRGGIDARRRIRVGGIIDPELVNNRHPKINVARRGSIMDEAGSARFVIAGYDASC